MLLILLKACNYIPGHVLLLVNYYALLIYILLSSLASFAMSTDADM